MNILDKIKTIILFILMTGTLTLITTIIFADNVRHVVWDKTFIPVQLPIGKEKIIEVCARESISSNCQTLPLTPYLPQSEVTNGTLKWINNNGTLYLNATKPFNNKLAELKLHSENGDIILVRLSASSSADDSRIEILLPEKQTNHNDSKNRDEISEDQSIGNMVRWVAQQLYAPKRLLTEPNWIYRVPMHIDYFVSLYRGDVVSSMPLASWRAGDYYVTAVLLRNVLQHQPVTLNYKLLRGQWIAASFFRQSRLNPSVLTPARTNKDSTTVILVSAVPFETALKEGTSDV